MDCDGEEWRGPIGIGQACSCRAKYEVSRIDKIPFAGGSLVKYVCGRHALAYQKFGRRIQKGGFGMWVVRPISNV